MWCHKRLKITTKTVKSVKTGATDMIQNMDVDMADNNDMQTTTTISQAQSIIKINDSVSAIAMTSVSIKKKMKTMHWSRFRFGSTSAVAFSI